MRVRPPWTRDAMLRESCTGCGLCREACMPGIIELDAERRPYVDFQRGGCNYCGACAAACAEDLFDADRAPWPLRAQVDGPCLTMPAATCGLCHAMCLADAVRFHATAAGTRVAEIDAALCNGCGACVSVCPTDAIAMRG